MGLQVQALLPKGEARGPLLPWRGVGPLRACSDRQACDSLPDLYARTISRCSPADTVITRRRTRRQQNPRGGPEELLKDPPVLLAASTRAISHSALSY